jgi:hypothetical protein
MTEATKQTTKKEAVAKKTTKKASKKAKKPDGNTIREITTKTKKARTELAKTTTFKQIEKDAFSGIKAVRDIVGGESSGKWSPLGHMASKQNGLLDIAILNCKTPDFAEWVKYVARNAGSRRSDVNDNKALIKRLKDHFQYLTGSTPAQARSFEKALTRVGKQDYVEEIMSSLTPAYLLFEEYRKAGKFA